MVTEVFRLPFPRGACREFAKLLFLSFHFLAIESSWPGTAVPLRQIWQNDKRAAKKALSDFVNDEENVCP